MYLRTAMIRTAKFQLDGLGNVRLQRRRNNAVLVVEVLLIDVDEIALLIKRALLLGGRRALVRQLRLKRQFAIGILSEVE